MPVFNFSVDEEYAKKHNELLKDTRRLQLSALLFALVQLAIGVSVYLFVGGGLGWIVLAVFGVMALVSLALIFVIPQQVGDAAKLYGTYELVPAVIAKVNPRDLTVMALVNMNVDPTAAPSYGLATRTITRLEGHERKVGERVPAVAVTGRRSTHAQTTWDQISPMPIAWGTPDKATVARAEKEIPADLWALLEKNIDKVDDVATTRYDLLPL
ncbi:DUF3239 domain-containing protein [Corynebacterium vitaeruminis]|uniref:DUF3239 domain-containing protein n=1 Tax=Corynebacterium vitaeruminis DSM 20294 TaxID=1224164 RepID=W5Y6R2_9CORY|nr:DUF3239 domain-containing protein [Corynebacterium vitaeruminis]AHI22208.1 hypothetical protein B843_04095 [Corynebacterium vitaeruminis DSM 20294]